MNFYQALKMFWRIWWRQEPVNVGPSQLDRSLDQLMHSDITGAVKMSMEKMKHEPHYPGRPRLWEMGDGHAKQREVKAWAYKYAKQMGHDEPSEWHINFMIEYLVGVEKGKI